MLPGQRCRRRAAGLPKTRPGPLTFVPRSPCVRVRRCRRALVLEEPGVFRAGGVVVLRVQVAPRDAGTREVEGAGAARDAAAERRAGALAQRAAAGRRPGGGRGGRHCKVKPGGGRPAQAMAQSCWIRGCTVCPVRTLAAAKRGGLQAGAPLMLCARPAPAPALAIPLAGSACRAAARAPRP
jgi:hypothetical protein